MKNAFAFMAAVAVSVVSSQASFASVDAESFVRDLNHAVLVTTVQPMDLINWKVGDTMEYNLKMAFGGGKSVKSVTKDEGAAIWITQVMNILGQNQKIEALINKADGKILKMLQNGQEVSVPNEQLEIISQEYTNITVPAGQFDCIHITAKSKQISKMEIWANPAHTCMDGSLKTVAATQFGDLTLELTKFTKMP